MMPGAALPIVLLRPPAIKHPAEDMMRSYLPLAALAAATILAGVACSGDDAAEETPAAATATTVATSAATKPASTAAASPTGEAQATPAASPSATTAAGKVSANNATRAELQAAFETAGISGAAQWAREVVEYRPYPENDPNMAKLRQELAKYNPGPGVVDKIIAALSLP